MESVSLSAGTVHKQTKCPAMCLVRKSKWLNMSVSWSDPDKRSVLNHAPRIVHEEDSELKPRKLRTMRFVSKSYNQSPDREAVPHQTRARCSK